MFEPVYHTWYGGMLAHVLLAGSWILGGGFAGGLCACAAGHTYGLSFLVLATVTVENKRARQAIACLACSLCVYMGPRSLDSPGFWRYWLSTGGLIAMSSWTYAFRMRTRPEFRKFIQDLDYTKYFTACELRGALEDIQKEGSVFGFHPHGAVCCGFSWNGCWNKKFEDLAGTTMWLCDRVLREDNPFFKVVCDWHGTIESLSKRTLLKYMGRKNNVAFIPGGFEDATIMEYGKHYTAMKKRTGFIKYALQHGYRLHPVYTFGETESYYTPCTGALKFRLWLNKFGIPAIVPVGFLGVPFLPLPAPKILTYVGKAIQLPKIAEPSKDDVAKWHKTYCEALVALFEANKKEAGLPDSAKLEIW